MHTTIKTVAAITLLGASSLANATVYNILDVMNGSSGFAASLFHDASGPDAMSGATLANIPNGAVLAGSYDDLTGNLSATIDMGGGDSFTLSGTGLLFDGSGTLAANSQLSISFSTPSGALQNDELGFLPGYVCCGGTDLDPNSFKSDGTNMVMTLWGANFGGGTFTGSYDDTSGNRLATFGIDLRFSLTPVPVPAAVWLFGSGLVGLVGFARRKRR